MRHYTGRVAELQSDYQGRLTAWIACPPGAIPAAGQYVWAYAPDIPEEVLPATLFAAEISTWGFQVVSPIPPEWSLGCSLNLWGPLGNGFRLDRGIRRLALAALQDIAYLTRLVAQALEQNADVTLFAEVPLPPLPASVEVSPLTALPEALTWADFLALDVPSSRLTELRSLLGLSPEGRLPCPAQVLVHTPMPCAGIAECGVCAVETRRGWKFACRNGPVFDLQALLD